MTIEKQLSNLRRQALRYCYIDGFADIALGVIFIIGAAGIALIGSIDSPLHWVVGAGMVLVVFGVGYSLTQAIKSLKERVTYPRTGYVQAQNNGGESLWVAALTASALLVLALILSRDDLPLVGSLNTEPAYNGIMLGILLAWMGYQARLGRWMGLAGVTLLSGIGLAASDINADIASALVYGITGVLLIGVGAWVLRDYLRQNPQED